jgi:O-antigen/teichoic acid export membrane protein
VIEASPEQIPIGTGLAARLVTNSVVQVAGAITGSAISFLTFVAVTRTLGPTGYGDLVAATVYLFIPAVVADVGLTATVVRRISGASDETERMLGVSVPLRALIAILLVGVFIAGSYGLPFDHRTRVAVLIASVGTVFALLNAALVPVFQARLLMHWPVLSMLVGRVVTLGLTYGVVAAGLGFKSFIWASVIGLVVSFGVTVYVVTRVLRIRLRPVLDVRLSRDLLRAGIVLGIALAVAQLYFRVDTVILALLRPSRDVGLYGASYKFLELSMIAPFAILNSIFPTLAGFMKRDDPRVTPLAQRAFDLGLTVAIPAMILAIAFAHEVIDVTAGRKYADGAIALKILAPYVVLTFALTPALALLLAGGADRLLLWLTLSILAVNVVVNLIFIPSYGFKAAAVTSVGSEALNFLALTVAARARLGFLPSLRVAPVIGAAAAVMVAAIAVVPGPAVVPAAAALLAYAAVVAAAPGAVRDVLVRAAGRWA